MSDESIYIKKKKDDSDELSFAGLRRQGLAYAQQLSGKIWTDYNLHDPGVTILEQLCFALTDLLYRTEYSVPDLLTGPDGTLHHAALSLHAPEEVFPCRPVTSDDYRSILFSEISELDNVWTEPLAGAENPFCGLHRILAAPSPHCNGTAEQLKKTIAAIYSKHRNLCEDIGEIVLLQPVPCRLEATVEINGAVAAEDVLAEIYHQCGRETAACPEVLPHAALAQQERPEDLFRGPLTGGRMQDPHQGHRSPPAPGRIFALLAKISGVEQVERFAFASDSAALKNILQAGGLPCYQLTVPESRQQAGVRLTKNGREAVWSWTQFRARLHELLFREQTLRQRSSASGLYPLPSGTYRNPGQYSSIQNLFPGIYGIGAHGAPESCSAERKAAAAQLKAYLLLFEQILADYLAQLEHLPALFSAEGDLRQSYFRQKLDSSKVPGVDKALAPDADSAFEQIRRQFDNYHDRKNRVLDYLLALHGERFTGKSLRSLNMHMRPDELEDHLLACKARLLKHVVQVTRDRSAAVNYQEAVWGNPDNISGLQLKTALLLGWEEGGHNRSLVETLRKEGFSLLDDRSGINSADAADHDDESLDAAPLMPPEDTSFAGLREKARPLLPKDGSIPASLLRDGVRLKDYGLAVRQPGGMVRVRFRPSGAAARWLPGRFADKEQAAAAVNALRCLLDRLNQSSEGMHVVEHILLRPPAACETEDEDFYSNRISVALPNWTARCGSREFQLLVEETVRLNCPAHVMPGFYWLDVEQMAAFEALYQSALAKRHCRESQDSGQQEAARALVSFLRRHEPEEDAW